MDQNASKQPAFQFLSDMLRTGSSFFVSPTTKITVNSTARFLRYAECLFNANKLILETKNKQQKNNRDSVNGKFKVLLV